MFIGKTLRGAAAATGLIALLGFGAPAFAQTSTGQPGATDQPAATDTMKPAKHKKHHASTSKHHQKHAMKSTHRTYKAQSKSPAHMQPAPAGTPQNPGGGAPNK